MSLGALIREDIAKSGFMRLDRYMSLCLMHPHYGYYTQRDPFGSKGDFVTAPEVSQMFGEMIGLWLAQVWQDQGSPPATLIELGPGRGTMMADVLRICAHVPGFLERVSVVLVEQSAHLIAVQKDRLKGHSISWQPSLSSLPDGPVFLIANEFFDALPIRQAERIDEIWLERVVRCEDDGDLRLGHAPLAADEAANLPLHARDGEITEWSEASCRLVSSLGQHIETHGGAALLIDYGRDGGQGDTLQAVKAHEYHGVLNEPGEADLSAHVDFAALAKAATPAFAAPLAEQGAFLAAMGIGQRAAQLAQTADAEPLADALERLTATSEMGQLFKVLGLRPQSAPGLPALEEPC